MALVDLEGFLTAGDADAVEEAIANGAFALDVRSPDEYDAGHIPTAQSAPVRTLGVTDVEIPTNTTVVVYCKSGWRAALSVPILHLLEKDTSKGFTGSWLAWEEAGKPIES